MRVVIAGGHGQIALRLERLLAARGDEAVGIVRNPAHTADLEAVGVQVEHDGLGADYAAAPSGCSPTPTP